MVKYTNMIVYNRSTNRQMDIDMINYCRQPRVTVPNRWLESVGEVHVQPPNWYFGLLWGSAASWESNPQPLWQIQHYSVVVSYVLAKQLNAL